MKKCMEETDKKISSDEALSTDHKEKIKLLYKEAAQKEMDEITCSMDQIRKYTAPIPAWQKELGSINLRANSSSNEILKALNEILRELNKIFELVSSSEPWNRSVVKTSDDIFRRVCEQVLSSNRV